MKRAQDSLYVTLAGSSGHRYNPSEKISTVREEVTDSMTPNWAGAVVNTLVLAFFVVIAIGVALGVYAARVMKKLEQKQETETE
jgi:hypothetical protein